MITDKQLQTVADVLNIPLSAILLRKALEAYEQSKPKPEPVGYYAPNLAAPPFNRGVLDAMYQITGNWVPLYTHPQTREPLSDSDIVNLINDMQTACGERLIDFARAIEQAHEIGTPHEST